MTNDLTTTLQELLQLWNHQYQKCYQQNCLMYHKLENLEQNKVACETQTFHQET